MTLPLFACEKNGDGGEKEPSLTPEVAAWAFHSYNKTVVNKRPQGYLKTSYTVYLAKGETEGCQVAVYVSNMELEDVTFCQTSENYENIEPSIYEMSRTHKISAKQYTDALVPYNGEKLTAKKRVTLPFMVEFKTNENTESGEYEYTYELRDKKGKALAVFNITVHVWDITLPKEKTFATAAGLTHEGIYYGGGAYVGWYNILLEHNICAYDIPFSILSDAADAYLSDPRVTSFRIPTPESILSLNENNIIAVYEKLKTHPEWLEKAYFYPLDEPRTKDHLAKLKAWEQKLTELCPEIEICAPYYTNIQVGDNRDQTDEMAEYTDLWCPKLCLWDDSRSYAPFLNYKPDKSFAERMAEAKVSGDRLWTYVCNSPDDPYAQLFIDTEGVNQRLMFWQMYQRDIEGFLYWSVNSYGRITKNPWENVNTGISGENGVTIYGCGFLFYPAKYVGQTNCVPSIRAKIIRDGVDDIELFYLAEKYLGKDWVLEKTKKGTPSLTEYTTDDGFAALRIEIGNALEVAMKNQ